MIEKLLSQVSILLVENHASHRRIVADILMAAGASRVRGCANVEDAVSVLATEKFDLLVVDWELDGTPGLSFVQSVRRGQHNIAHDVPAVMLTGRNALADVLEARDAGVDEYATKPISTEKLLTRVRAALYQRRPFVQCVGYVGPCRRRRNLGEAYKGVRRRLDDVDVLEIETEALIAAKSTMRQASSQLAKLDDDQLKDRRVLRKTLDQAVASETAALETGDTQLIRASQSLVRYLNAFGASGKVEAKVITAHAEAINVLMELSGSINPEVRDEVAVGLEQVIQKKLRQAG